MAEQQIIDYLRNGLYKGYSIDSLRKALIDAGWDGAKVDEAIGIVEHGQGSVPSPPHPMELPGLPGPLSPVAEPASPQGGSRTRGVTMIGILGFIVSGLSLVAGFFLLFAGSFLGSIVSGVPGSVTVFGDMESVLLIFSLIPIIVGFCGFLAFYLLLRMKKAGWTLVIFLAMLGIASSMAAFDLYNVFSVSMWLVIVIYLFMKSASFT